MLAWMPFLATGQQDAQYTQWQWNKLLINPGYAGSADALSINLLGRKQWVGIPGAPQTATFGIHSPINTKSINLGVSGYYDELGYEQKMGLNLDYAYGIEMGVGHLHLGIRAAFELYNADLQNVFINQVDPNFSSNIKGRFIPNFGVGAFYYTKIFWIGGSVPHILNNQLLDENNNPINSVIASQARHHMFTTGYIILVNSSVKLRPSLLLKYVDGTPMSVDLNLAAKFKEKVWVGVGHRPGDAYNFNVEYMVSRQLSVGYAYDLTTSNLAPHSNGTHEVLIGYDFVFEGKKITTPRNIQTDF